MGQSFILTVFGVLCLATAGARAGEASAAELGDCGQPPSREEVLRLTQQRADAGRALAQERASLASSGGECPAAGACRLRDLQRQLLEVMERLECRPQAPAAEVTGTFQRKGLEAPSFVRMPVLYATDRDRSEPALRKDPATYYTGNVGGGLPALSYGTATVTIPTLHHPGDLDLPAWWTFTRRSDPDRYFVLEKIEESDRAALVRLLNNGGGGDDRSSLLLFIHGFNVGFPEAIFRTAQLAHDLSFPGQVMAYSWPSGGRIWDYWKDEETVALATPDFETLLKSLLATKVRRIYIVAHSMGTRIVIPAVADLRRDRVRLSKVSQLMLAAADFNRAEFQNLAETFAQLRAAGTRTTLYAASNDFALQASKIVHVYPRLGESDPRIAVFTGVDSIDASAAAPVIRAFGHAYVVDSPPVLKDIASAVLAHLAPPQRGLVAVPGTDGRGWMIRGPN